MAKDIWDKKDIMHINDTDYDEKLIDHLKTFWIPELTKLKIMKLTTKSNHTKSKFDKMSSHALRVRAVERAARSLGSI